MRTFQVTPGPHGQLCIQAHDLSGDECAWLRRIVLNNRTDSPDYKACQPARPFLQGYEEPFGYNPWRRNGLTEKKDGWVLVEFWADDRAAIDTCVAYINEQFKEL